MFRWDLNAHLKELSTLYLNSYMLRSHLHLREHMHIQSRDHEILGDLRSV